MKYSVIIPCYNASGTLPAALESLTRQHIQNFEVIVIDDASADFEKTQTVIDNFKNYLNIELIKNDTNRNGSYSRNRGIQAARGKYIAFLDADDRWPEDRLAIADELIDEITVPEFIIYGQFELLRSHYSGALLPLRGINRNESVGDYVFAAGQHMQTSTFVCSKAVATDVLFDENLTRHQDSDFMMRAQHKGILLVFQKKKCAFYNFRAHDLHLRVQAGRINSSYCKNWLRSKAPLLSKTARAGYELTVLSRIAQIESGNLEFFKIASSAIFRIGAGNIYDLFCTKIVTFYRTRLGQ